MRADRRHPLVPLIEGDPLLGVGAVPAEGAYRVAGLPRTHDEAPA